jgi:lysophospholipase L1-like esterase
VTQARQKGDLDFVLYGDSISKGLVEYGLFDRFGSRAADLAIKNDLTEHLRWRMLHGETDFGDHPPKQAVILIGANNIEANGPKSKEGDANAVAAIVKTIELAHRRMPNTEIIAMAVLPQYSAETIARVNKINQQVANEISGIPNVRFVDVGKRFLLPNGTRNPKLWAGGLHPSLAGYGVLADAIAEVIKPKTK